MTASHDTLPTAPGGRFSQGDRINARYTIQKLLGEGGFAAVYLARQDGLDQDVALKVLEVADESDERDQVIKRFMREASVSSQLRHPNIVGIFECGLLEGDLRPFIAMEFLNGHDLEEELKRNGAMTFGRARQLIAGSLDALALAHREGVVHKDLKPSNLFIDHPGQLCEALRVVDFGVARLVRDEEGKMTSTGQIFGTPHYLSPEYIERLEATPALDVYQMGLIFVEMLTGRTVVQGENMFRCMMTHCLGEVRVPLALVDSPLGPVIARALCPNPDQRYPEARSFLKALMAIDASAVPAPPIEGKLIRVTDIQAWRDDPSSVALTDGPEPIPLDADAPPLVEAVTRQLTTSDARLPGPAAAPAAAPPHKSRANASLEVITFSALVLVALIIAALPALVYRSSNPRNATPPATAVTSPATTAAGAQASPPASPAKTAGAPADVVERAAPPAAPARTAPIAQPQDAATSAPALSAPPAPAKPAKPAKPPSPGAAPAAEEAPDDAPAARPVKRPRPAKPAKPSITFIDDSPKRPPSKTNTLGVIQ